MAKIVGTGELAPAPPTALGAWCAILIVGGLIFWGTLRPRRAR